MTSDQIKFLEGKLNKDNGKGRTVALSTFYDFDNGICFRNNNDFVIFDDSNELIHCISANRHPNVKDEAPYVLISAPYTMLQYTEYNLDKDGLETVLDDVFSNLLSDEGKKIILNWADHLPVHPKNPNVGMDYYKTMAPEIAQRPINSETNNTEAASPKDPDKEAVKSIEKEVEEFVAQIPNKNTSYTSISMTNHTISAVINSTEDLDVGLTEFLESLDGLDTVVFTSGDKTFNMNIKDESSYNSFKEGVISFMPNTQNGTATGTFKGTVGEQSVVYTLKVKYYNRAEDNCEVNGVCYTSLNKAIESIGSEPATIVLKNDMTEDVVVPSGANVTLDLGGKTLMAKTATHTIKNSGVLTLTGSGMVEATADGCAAIDNEVGGDVTILGGTIARTGETSELSDKGTGSYYVIKNLGTMIIGAAGAENTVTVKNENGKYSSLITNGWYSTTGMTGNESATLEIFGGEFIGGKNTIKNDELGSLKVHGGEFTNYAQASLLNWHICEIDGGKFVATDLEAVCNGASGMGIGKLAISGGVFDAGANPCVTLHKEYPSNDVTVTGGVFSSDISAYLAEGYKEEIIDGKYVVIEETVEDEVDDIIDGLSGLEVEKDPLIENTYSITTSGESVSESGLFDQVAALEGLKSIVVSDGNTEVTYSAGGDLDAFKASVDDLCPKTNDDPEVTLTMTVVSE